MTADGGGDRAWKEKTKDGLRSAYLWAERRVPRGLRAVIGIPLIIGGILGFLPILGFWMLPLGAMLVALDVAPLRRRLRAWLDLPERGAAEGRSPGTASGPSQHPIDFLKKWRE